MTFCWVTIHVADLDRSLSFYRDFLGLETDRRITPAAGTEIVFLGKGDTMVELMHAERGSPVLCNTGLSLGFEVSSLEEAMAELARRSIPVEEGPIQPMPTIRFLFIRDPDGVRIQLVENVKE